MFKDEDVIKFCLRYRMKVNQYYFMYLLARKDFYKTYKESLAKQYLMEIEKFEYADMADLVERGFIEDMNSPGETLPEMFMLKEEALRLFIDEDLAEQLWELYPPTLPLSNGASFIARAGGSKEEILALYRQKIDYRREKHDFVMKQLANYIKLVRAGKINGHKISDWIKMEVWDTVGELVEQENVEGFGEDI
jgi:hypothetical protein